MPSKLFQAVNINLSPYRKIERKKLIKTKAIKRDYWPNIALMVTSMKESQEKLSDWYMYFLTMQECYSEETDLEKSGTKWFQN